MKSADSRDAENVVFRQHAPKRPACRLRLHDRQSASGKASKRRPERGARRAPPGRGRLLRPGPYQASATVSSCSFCTCWHTSAARDDGGSRVAISMYGSPLFTGDAGSGEIEIRRWIPANDLLEALIARPSSYVISRSAVRVRSPAPMKSTTYSDLQFGEISCPRRKSRTPFKPFGRLSAVSPTPRRRSCRATTTSIISAFGR